MHQLANLLQHIKKNSNIKFGQGAVIQQVDIFSRTCYMNFEPKTSSILIFCTIYHDNINFIKRFNIHINSSIGNPAANRITFILYSYIQIWLRVIHHKCKGGKKRQKNRLQKWRQEWKLTNISHFFSTTLITLHNLMQQ